MWEGIDHLERIATTADGAAPNLSPLYTRIGKTPTPYTSKNQNLRFFFFQTTTGLIQACGKILIHSASLTSLHARILDKFLFEDGKAGAGTSPQKKNERLVGCTGHRGIRSMSFHSVISYLAVPSLYLT